MSIASQAPHVTVVIADDHEIVRAGLRAALESPGLVDNRDLKVVAEAEDGFATLAAVKQYRPDLLLLDLTMPLSGGAEVITDIRRWSPDTRIVVFSSVTNAGTLSLVVEAGVDGLFAKGGPAKLLYEKLPWILRGGRFIAPEILALIKDAPPPARLTPREQQTLHMLLAGRSTKEIAQSQGISPRTAEKHRASLMAKLGVRTLPDLMARALQDGLLDHTPTSGQTIG